MLLVRSLQDLAYMRSRDPRGEKFGVTIVEQLHTKTRRRWKPISIPLLKMKTKKRINFSFLSNRFALDSFCYWFLIKFVRQYPVSALLLAIINRVFFIMVIRQGSPLGFLPQR